MQIERDYHTHEPEHGARAAPRPCLDCDDCTGACWHLRELQALPGAILRGKSNAVHDQRHMQ